MANDVLTAVPLFLFMGYIVERANIVNRLFDTLYVSAKKLPGAMAVAALATCALFATATGIIGAVVTLMGMLALPAMLRAKYDTSLRLRRDLRRRLPRNPHSAVDHADRLCGNIERFDRPALCGRDLPRLPAGRPLHGLCHRPGLAEPQPGAETAGGRNRRSYRRPDRLDADHVVLPACVPDPVGAGRNPVRPCDAVRGRIGRCARRASPGSGIPGADLAAVEGVGLSDGTDIGDGLLAVRRVVGVSRPFSPISAENI